MYDYINRVVITLPLTVYEGTWTYTLPSRCYAITMILRVRRNFFEITTFPNSTYLPSQVNLYVPNSKPSNEILFCMLE